MNICKRVPKTTNEHTPSSDELTVRIGNSIADAITLIDSTSARVALLVDGHGRLINTITDGDIRRGILADLTTADPLMELIRHKEIQRSEPVVAPVSSSPDEQKKIMLENGVRHLPLIDDSKRLAGLVLLSEFIEQAGRHVSGVIFAGGLGSRLSPLTDDTPKPMLPIGGRPILEWVIDQLKSSNIRDILITTHYQPARITDYFGDGEKFGVDIRYVHESEQRGTAGGLRLFERPNHPILVVNGDILTNLHFRNMLDFHAEHDAEMTVAVRKYQTRVDYGVVESEGIEITSLVEKPVIDFLINAGIYVLEPSCFDHFPSSGRFDMTDLIGNLIGSGRNVISFPIRESWLDIGQHSDYERAVRESDTNGESR